MDKKILILLAIIISLMTIISAYSYQTVYNPFTGKLDYHITSNMSGLNLTADYIFGQPLTGSIDSGIIYASQNVAGTGSINVSDEGSRVVNYTHTIHRIHNTDGTIIYCDIPDGKLTATDNRHSVYYIDNSCTIQSDTFENFFNKDISPGDYSRLFDVYAINGEIEELKGASLMAVSERKTRRHHVEVDHLTISSGVDISEGTFSVFALSSGSYSYINTILDTNTKNSTEDGVDVVSHVSGDWVHRNQSELNLTHCDDGTDTIACPNNLYRRYIIGVVGSEADTKLHQLVPLTTDSTFTTFASCIDTIGTPISYTLPDSDKYVWAIAWAYCGKRDDVAWRDGAWLDLRAPAGIAGGVSVDTSAFLDIYGSRSLVANWNAGAFSITADYFIGDGSQLTNVAGGNFSWNQTLANTLYADIIWGHNMSDGSYNLTYSNWNKTYADTIYRLDSWNNFTGIPHAAPSNGDVTHFSLADEIYDWAVGLFLQAMDYTNIAMTNITETFTKDVIFNEYVNFSSGGYMYDNGTALILGHT